MKHVLTTCVYMANKSYDSISLTYRLCSCMTQSATQ